MLEATISFTSFPLRLKGAYLQRTAEADSVVALIGIMARTPRGSWQGCAEFGLREDLEHAGARPELPLETIGRVNATLGTLGITNFRVESIVREPGSALGAAAYVINLIAAAGGEPFGVRVEI